MAGPCPTLIYDGDCGFCTSSARWIAARWRADNTPVAVPWQQLTAEQVDRWGLTDEDFATSAFWVDGDRIDGGHRSIARALMAARAPWATCGRILLWPPVSWVAPFGYRMVARWRHHLPGGTPACRL